MPISDRPWSEVSESDYETPEAFCSASLVDLNSSGQQKTKENCHLPVYEPGGALNRAAVHAVATVLAGGRGGVQIPADAKRQAARKLISLYRELDEDPPESVRRMAR